MLALAFVTSYYEVSIDDLQSTLKLGAYVTCLLFLCFPVEMGLWIFLAAVLAGQVTRSKKHEEKKQ